MSRKGQAGKTRAHFVGRGTITCELIEKRSFRFFDVVAAKAWDTDPDNNGRTIAGIHINRLRFVCGSSGRHIHHVALAFQLSAPFFENPDCGPVAVHLGSIEIDPFASTPEKQDCESKKQDCEKGEQ
jgi:hypothetical protein